MTSVFKWAIALMLFVCATHPVLAMGNKPPASAPAFAASGAEVITTKYGDKTWDQYTWLGAHNAFASLGAGHGAWIVVNQRKSYEDLLTAGVRNIDLDIYDFK